MSSELNKARLFRASDQLSNEQRTLLWLLPWLLHTNHPDNPGYVEGAPEGFERPPITRKPDWYIRELDASHSLLGLYTMGSTGTFGQSQDSDIDCWLVHPVDMSPESRLKLAQKCEALSSYFQQKGLELHLYLIRPDMLQQGQAARLSSEHSGSAQSWLLLEEFYRTQIHLAGYPLAWWPGAPQDHPELLSLGELKHLPSAEFFSAALWQLFKGLDRPHKATLKVLLLEAYAANYPDQRVLRDELWNQLRAGARGTDIDPYLMLFRRLTTFLRKEGDWRRLDLVKRCFYLKCGVRLSRKESRDDWRHPTLKQLTQAWQWSHDELKVMDRARHWHADNLRWYNERLDQAMLTSYQRLTGFAQRLKQRSPLKLEELGVLTRKLYTRFDTESSKIPVLNPLWSKALEEPALTLVAVENSQQQVNGWYLYRHAPEDCQLFGESPLFYDDTREACITWALHNGLISNKTRFYCHRAGVTRFDHSITSLAKRLKPYLVKPGYVGLAQLQQPWRYVSAVVLCNTELDPTAHHEQNIEQLFSVLEGGKHNSGMVGDLTLLTTNSWGEYHCFHFNDDDNILALSTQLLSGLDKPSGPIPIKVVCNAKKYPHRIENEVTELLQKLQGHYCNRAPSNEPAYTLKLGNNTYDLVIDVQGARWQRQEVTKQSGRSKPLSDARSEQIGLVRGAASILGLYARKGLIQIFVREHASGIDVFLLDESNQVKQLQTRQQPLPGLMEELNQVYFKPCDFKEGLGAGDSFNLPQFYRLVNMTGGGLSVEPFSL